MRFKTLTTITAVLFVLVGLGFTLDEFSLLRTFGPVLQRPQRLLDSSASRMELLRLYVGLRAFAVMFGGVLFGCGLLTWALRNLRDAALQTNVTLALFGLNVVAGALAVTQQHGIWRAHAGWIIAGVFFAQAVGYAWLLVMRSKAAPTLLVTAEAGAEGLREQWVQQIHEAAAQQERNRLARELHDAIKQQLFSINVNAATVQARWDNDEAGARTALEAVRGSVREAMAEMEAMLHNLRPAPLETVGLVEALRQQCEALEYRTGAHVTAEIGSLPAPQEWPAGAQEAIFRIVQEALSNIARHARASQVRVRLHQQTGDDADALWLKIEDDGSGFTVTDAAAGMGLTNIRARVAELGGSLQLASRADEGTSLTIRLPLAASASNEVRRDLRLAFVFTLVGFLAAGSWILSHTGPYWPLAGLAIFPLSALLCYRAAKTIKSMQAAGAASLQRLLELRGQWHQVVAILIAALMWSLEHWHVIAQTYNRYIPNETLFLLAWPVLTVCAVYRVHQLLRLQARSLTAAEFLVSLTGWWQRVSVLLAMMLLFLLARPGIMAYPLLKMILILQGYGPRLAHLNFQPLRAFWMATLALLLYWLYLTAWRLQLQRRARVRSAKGNYDSRRIG